MPGRSYHLSCILSALVWLSFKHVTVATTPLFTTEGPVLTLTLKDPDTSDSLQPSLLYSVLTQRPPFPKHFPALRNVQAAVGYKPHNNNQASIAPTFVEAVSKFDLNHFQLQCQSSYDLPNRTIRSIVQAIRGSNYAMVRFVGKSPVEAKASYYRQVTPWASLSSVRITPSWNIGGPTVQLEAVSGGAGRTKLMYQDKILSVQYQQADHVVRPEIHLVTGKVVYQYMTKLKNHGSFRLSVDPTQAIEATWVDGGAMGSWVTDIKVPLSEGSKSTPQIRIRRFFQF